MSIKPKLNLSILIYSLASGGAERVVSILLEELKEKFNIRLVLMNDTIFYDLPIDIPVVYLEHSDATESGLFKLLKLPLLALKYKKLCKSNDIDISLSFMNRPNYINILAKLFGSRVKTIISERAMPSLQHKNGVQGLINKTLINFLYAKADVITANSKGNSLDLVKNFRCRDVVTINNPFDIDKIQSLYKEEVVLEKDRFTFITVGRLDSGKNHKLILDAIKDLDARLYIIGDGELREFLEKQIIKSDLQDKVILLGRQANPYKYLRQADCFLFSSNYEGFPNVLLEALACGLPIISTDCQSGPREILAPDSDICFELKDDIELAKYGVLTPVNNAQKLSEAMELMMRDVKLRDEYTKKARARSSEFDKSVILSEWIGVL
ncbi:MAG: glycosyltransferase [Sulfurimonas sp.]|nr:glycosyltransferase [Sulfurimonas sp.]